MNVMRNFMWVVATMSCFACMRLPTSIVTYTHERKIKVGGGPEDMEVYRWGNGIETLLVSCDDRRNSNVFGSIWAVDLSTDSARPLPVKFIRPPVEFHPHGISIVDSFLFVIDHVENYKKSCIRRFIIRKDSLMEDTVFQDGLIGYPNDVKAISKNNFLYSDYSPKGAVVRYDNGIYYRLTKKVKMANGIDSVNVNGYPFGIVSATFGKRVYVFDTQSGEQRKYFKVKGGDNFSYNDHKLLITAHLRFYKFIRHVKVSKNKSPSVVYELDILNKTKQAVFVDDGHKISAASVAIWVNDKLYIGQIFDDFIWVTGK
jgi:hypothetical protein